MMIKKHKCIYLGFWVWHIPPKEQVCILLYYAQGLLRACMLFIYNICLRVCCRPILPAYFLCVCIQCIFLIAPLRCNKYMGMYKLDENFLISYNIYVGDIACTCIIGQ